jgi:hypothetical protein
MNGQIRRRLDELGFEMGRLVMSPLWRRGERNSESAAKSAAHITDTKDGRGVGLFTRRATLAEENNCGEK